MFYSKYFLIAFIFFASLFPCIETSGQENWTNYTKEDGLVSNYFRRIGTDPLGNLWIATFDHGLYKYDGNNWILYTKKDGLLSNVIVDMLIDSEGKIWVLHSGFKNGVSIFNGSNWKTIKFPGFINCIAEGPDKTIYVGTGMESYFYDDRQSMENLREIENPGGIYIYKDSLWTFITSDDFGLPLKITNVTALYPDSKGQLWIGARAKRAAKGFLNKGRVGYLGGCIILKDSAEFKIMMNDEEYPDTSKLFVNCLLEDHLGYIWIGSGHQGNQGSYVYEFYPTSGCLKRFDGENCISITIGNELIDNYISFLYEDRENQMWVGTANGVTRFDSIDQRSFIRGKEIMNTNYISGVCEDRNGFYWLATGSGIFKTTLQK